MAGLCLRKLVRGREQPHDGLWGCGGGEQGKVERSINPSLARNDKAWRSEDAPEQQPPRTEYLL